MPTPPPLPLAPPPPPPPAIIEIQHLHLPIASSFYAAIIQPLGLQYLFSTPTPHSPTGSPASPSTALSSPNTSAPSLHYGILSAHSPPHILFTLVPRSLPRPSYITLAAASPHAITAFHHASVLAHRTPDTTLEMNPEHDSVARARDFDGNMIEAVYAPHAGRHASAPSIHTVASGNEARRVLAWQEDVARSISDSNSEVSPLHRRAQAAPPVTYQRADSAPLRLVRRETTITTEHFRHDDDAAAAAATATTTAPPRPAAAEESAGGISTKALIGTVLGAAAGVAFAYAMVKSESQEGIPAAGGVKMARRASHDDHRAPVMVETEHLVECAPIPMPMTMPMPSRSYISTRESYADEHGQIHEQASRRPEYVSRNTAPVPLQRDLGRIEEGTYVSHRDSHHRGSQRGSQHGGSGSGSGGSGSGRGSRRRSHSEVGSGTRYERPLTILPRERDRSPGSSSSRRGSQRGGQLEMESRVSSHRSSRRTEEGESERHRDREREREGKAATYVTSRSSLRPESVVTVRKASSRSSRHGDADSKVSAKTASTLQYAPAAAAPSRAESGSSTTTIRVLTAASPKGEGGSRVSERERRSVVSARQVPLPRSVVSGKGYKGSVHGGGSEVGSVVGGAAPSLAPSDSVSSVGSKRERERLRERMARRGSAGY